MWRIKLVRRLLSAWPGFNFIQSFLLFFVEMEHSLYSSVAQEIVYFLEYTGLKYSKSNTKSINVFP